MKKLAQLISVFKEFKDELQKDGNAAINTQIGAGLVQPASSATSSLANAFGGTSTSTNTSTSTMKAEGDEPKKGHSSFTMDHVNAVVKMPHKEAMAHAHAAVDSSTANPMNKAKMKLMIDRSKSSSHLAQGMSNHMLAHPSEGLKVKKNCDEKMSLHKNGQWSLDKVDPEDLPPEDGNYEHDKEHTAKLLAPHPKSGQRGINPIPLAGRNLEEDKPGKTKILEVNKVDPQENVNIPHPQKAPVMARDSNSRKCPKCKGNPCKCAN